MLVDWISETVFPQMRIEDIAASHPGAIKIGPFGSQLKKEDLSEFGYKVYGQENIIANDFSIGKRRIDNSKFLSLKSCRLFPGDLVITMMGTIGKCTVFPDNAEVGIMDSHLLRIQVNTEIADKKFMALVIAAEEVVGRQISQMSHGSIMSGLSSSIVRRLRVPLPPLNEQQYIVEILDTIDEEIAHTSSIIAKLKQIKAGLLHDLLTRGLDENGELRDAIAHPEQFKDSPLGKIPKDWEVKTCESLCHEIVVGIVIKPSQYYQSSGVPVLRSANVRETGLDPSDLVFMSDQSNRLLGKSMIRTGNVLTVRTGYPGTSCVVPPEFDGSNCIDIIISRPGTEIEADFLATWINSDFGKNQVFRVQGGLAQQHFNVRELQKLLVAKPSIEEQRKIKAILNTHETRIRAEETYLEKLKLQKKGLMHDLLTGKVRVNQMTQISDRDLPASNVI